MTPDINAYIDELRDIEQEMTWLKRDVQSFPDETPQSDPDLRRSLVRLVVLEQSQKWLERVIGNELLIIPITSFYPITPKPY